MGNTARSHLVHEQKAEGVSNSAAGNANALTAMFAEELAAPGRDLQGTELYPAQPLDTVWN
jgi:hypothetical protein